MDSSKGKCNFNLEGLNRGIGPKPLDTYRQRTNEKPLVTDSLSVLFNTPCRQHHLKKLTHSLNMSPPQHAARHPSCLLQLPCYYADNSKVLSTIANKIKPTYAIGHSCISNTIAKFLYHLILQIIAESSTVFMRVNPYKARKQTR